MCEMCEISRATFHRIRAGGGFPEPVLVGKSKRWRLSDVRRWLGLSPLTEKDATPETVNVHVVPPKTAPKPKTVKVHIVGSEPTAGEACETVSPSGEGSV